MDNTTRKQPHQTKPNKPTHRFLLCFGFSSRKKSLSRKIVQPMKTDQPKKKIKHQPWFSWLRTFNMKKTATKTVPLVVESSLPDHQKVHVSKSKKLMKRKSDHDHKLFSRSQNQIASHNSPRLIPATAEVHTSSEHASKQEPLRDKADQQNIIINQNGKHSDHVDPPKDDTCQKRLSFRRREDAKKGGLGPPEADRRSTRTESIRRSASFRVVVKEKNRNANKLDPMIGMSMIMLTLIITLLWGRLCAILCTCACFYFVPRLVNHTDVVKNGLGSDDPNLNSEEYKQKVVLEGFLERNHRHLNLM